MLALLALVVALASGPLVHGDVGGMTPLWPRVEALRDDDLRYSATTIADPSLVWRPASVVSATHSATRWRPATMWFRFRVTAERGPINVLVSWHARDAMLVVPRPGAPPLVERTGGFVPTKSKPRYEAQNILPLPPEALDGRTIYLLVRSSFDHNSVFQLIGEARWSAARLEWSDYAALELVLAGFVLAFGALNILLALRLRRAAYAYYGAAVFAAALQVVVLSGHAWVWLWPALPLDYDLAVYVSYTLAIGFAALFGRAFLQIPRHHRIPDRVVLAGLGVFVAFNALVILVPERLVAIGVYDTGEVLATAAVLVPLALATLLRARAGDREARLYLFAICGILVGNGLGEAGRNLLIPQTLFVRLAPTLGFAWEALLLSLALAERMRTFEVESTIDPLTRLANRRALERRLAEERAHASRTGAPLSVLMLDVDFFKKFNDRYGHPAGDAALREVAGALATALRSIDVGARYGGEEFAALLPGTDLGGALVVGERVCAAVRTLRIPHADGIGGFVTVSVGVAETETSESGEAALGRADGALYAAKSGGRDRVAAAEPAYVPFSAPK